MFFYSNLSLYFLNNVFINNRTTPTPTKTSALIKKSEFDKSKNINRIMHKPTRESETYLKYFSFRAIPKINNPKASRIQKNVKIPLSNVKYKKQPILKVAG